MHKLLAGLTALAALSCADAALAAKGKPSPNAPTFVINDVSVSENAQIASLTITKTGSARSSSVLRVRTVNSTAISGSDYTSFDQNVSLSKNTYSVVVNIPIIEDGVHEDTETFRVVLTVGSNAVIKDNTGVVTITDNDDEVPTTKMCPDHTVIPIDDDCPSDPPPVDDPGDPEPDPEKDLVIIQGDENSLYSSVNWPGIYQTATSTSQVISRAVGSSTIDGLAMMLPGTLADAPAVVVMFYGTNDLTGPNWVSAQNWVDTYSALIKQAQDASVKTVAIVPLPKCNDTTYNSRRADVITRMVAQFGYNLVRTDQDSRLSNGCNTTYFQADGVHLTTGATSGQTVLAGLAKTKIDAVIAGGTQSDPTQSPEPPPPPPTPEPPVVTGWVNSPNSLTGETFVDGGFDITTGYTPSWGSGAIAPVANDVVGAFRFICGAGELLYDDPIVYPGQAGNHKSHLHQFYGNTLANGDSTYSSLRTTGGSTCNQIGDMTTALNRSSYWMPAMLDGAGHVIQPDYVAIYYKRRPATDPKCSNPAAAQYEGQCINLPNGIKFIFGYDMLTGKPPTGAPYFNCDGPGATQGHYPDIPTAKAYCPAGSRLGVIITAPSCWDGVHLDSPNHRDHVAYKNWGTWGYPKCPTTHPYVIPDFTFQVWYSIEAGDNLSNWQASSDAMVPNVPHGTTYHADFFMAWDQTAHTGTIGWSGPNGCINKLLNCSGGDMGVGKQLRGAAVPFYNGVGAWKNPNRLVAIP